MGRKRQASRTVHTLIPSILSAGTCITSARSRISPAVTDRNAVYSCFGFAQPAKNALREVFLWLGQGRLRDHRLDLRKMTMLLLGLEVYVKFGGSNAVTLGLLQTELGP